MSRKLTVADLLERRERKRQETRAVEVPGLGGELEIRRLPLVRFLELSDRVKEDSTAEELLRAQYDMIYAFCPILHSQELLEGCQVPTDIVPKVFGDDMGAMNTVVNAIAAMYGVESQEDEIKN